MTARAIAIAAAMTLAACSANLDGQPIHFGGAPTAAAGPTGDGAAPTVEDRAASAPAGVASACRPQRWSDPWPTLDRPADPWLAVVDGKPAPVSLPTEWGSPGAPTTICDAAHDHCFRDCTWLVTQPRTAVKDDRVARQYHVDAGGDFRERHDSETRPDAGFTAYRSVPVTRANLRVGVLAMALEAPQRNAGRVSGEGTLTDWDVGIVESIDWDGGLLRLVGRDEPYFLSAARVAVLRYRDGGKVEAIAGVDARAPSVDEVISAEHQAVAHDPWAAVGRDGQPIASSDAAPLPHYFDDCAGRYDHCLKPWVWFVEVEHAPVPARWTGTGFVHADQADAPIVRPGVAYRTRPATAATLAPGQRVIVYGGRDTPSTPNEAHQRRGWDFVEVASVDRAAGTFVDRDPGQRHFIDGARVLVLYWLPGDKAAPVD